MGQVGLNIIFDIVPTRNMCLKDYGRCKSGTFRFVLQIMLMNIMTNEGFTITLSEGFTTRRKQPPEMFYEKESSQKFSKIHRSTPLPVSFLIKLQA